MGGPGTIVARLFHLPPGLLNSKVASEPIRLAINCAPAPDDTSLNWIRLPIVSPADVAMGTAAS